MSARIENVSLSGSFIAVAEHIPEQTPVIVELAKQDSGMTPPWRVPGHVVRETETGIGVEWSSFAPWAILCLLRHNTVGRQFGSRSDAARLSAIQHHCAEGVFPVIQAFASSRDRERLCRAAQ